MHSRLGMGLSGLKQHRKDYHFIDSGSCDYCLATKEDTKHYLLVCPSFAAKRVEMFQRLVYALPDIATLVHKSNERNKLCLKLLFGINDFE